LVVRIQVLVVKIKVLATQFEFWVRRIGFMVSRLEVPANAIQALVTRTSVPMISIGVARRAKSAIGSSRIV
jgi:hypothetical protein